MHTVPHGVVNFKDKSYYSELAEISDILVAKKPLHAVTLLLPIK